MTRQKRAAFLRLPAVPPALAQSILPILTEAAPWPVNLKLPPLSKSEICEIRESSIRPTWESSTFTRRRMSIPLVFDSVTEIVPDFFWRLFAVDFNELVPFAVELDDRLRILLEHFEAFADDRFGVVLALG